MAVRFDSFRVAVPTLVALAALALAACAGGEERGPGSEVPDPELSRHEPQVLEAIQAARADVLNDLSSADAWGALATVFDAHLLTDLAQTCYERAHELAPDDFRWIYLLAVVREINGADAEEMIELFHRAAALRPDYAPVYIRLGDGLWRRGRHDEAEGELQKAIRLAPDAALAYRRLGQVALTRNDAAKARAFLEKAIELEPRDLAAYTALSQACNRLGDEEAARETIARARGLEPVNSIHDPVHGREVQARNIGSDHLFGEAVRWIQAGRFDEAIEAMEVVVSVSPANPSVHYWLGTAYFGSGQPVPAEEHLARAVELAPRLNAARLRLADLLVTLGRRDEAAAHYREALRLAPDDASIRSRLAGL